MKIKIYQVSMERDIDNFAFMNLDFLQRKQGNREPNSSDYDLVFEGNVGCKNLEEVYTMFNMNHPAGYKARSLSVSDVVEVIEGGKVEPGFYYCDSIGFEMVSFDPSKTQVSNRFCDLDRVDKITVLFVRAGQPPEKMEIENDLKAMQRLVGGDIEEYMPFEDEVAIICNEEGKVMGLPLNRAVYAEPEPVEMTYTEVKRLFREVESEGKKHLICRVVFTEDSFTKPYSEAARTYEFSSDNKAFIPGMGGYSIFGSAIDGSDNGVRLEQYMMTEHGGKDGWKIEKCYLMEDKHKVIDIIAGDFFIAYAPVDSEKYLSLPDRLERKYSKLFRSPETFIRTEDGIKVLPMKPASKDMER